MCKGPEVRGQDVEETEESGILDHFKMRAMRQRN